MEPKLTPIMKIDHPLGAIYHGMKASEDSFKGFGEAYFSNIHYAKVKGWKMHTKMVLNLVVPVGKIRFVVLKELLSKERNFDVTSDKLSDYESWDFILGEDNYQRLTVYPNTWMAFQGYGEGHNLLLNLASIEHDPQEAVSMSLDSVDYDWSLI